MRTPKSVDKLPHLRLARRREPDRDEAQNIAIEALAFLADDSKHLERFLALSGLTPVTLRAAAAGAGFLLAILDHIAADDALLVDFSVAAGHDPGDVIKARAILGRWQPE